MVMEPDSPGDNRLSAKSEPDAEVASGANALVIGPYRTRRRPSRTGTPEQLAEAEAIRPYEARLEEAVGLAGAIELNVVD